MEGPLLRKVWLVSKLRDSGPSRFQVDAGHKNQRWLTYNTVYSVTVILFTDPFYTVRGTLEIFMECIIGSTVRASSE